MAVEKKKTQEKLGWVISNKMQKTVVVGVETRKRHPLYKKDIKRTVKFKAHDDMGCKEGDWVRIRETRPLSHEKRWRVVEIVARGEVAEVQPKEIT